MVDHVCRPVGRGYSDWAIIVSPVDEGMPSKTNVFDATVVAGTPGCSRAFVPRLVVALVRRAQRGSLFHGLTLASYERLVKKAATSLGLQSLRVSPHSARHCGPSEDAYAGRRDLEAIRHRGRWASVRSVQRYMKFGQLLRQLAKLSEDQLRRARDAEATMAPSRLRAVDSLRFLC